jgi:hypothetical protein
VIFTLLRRIFREHSGAHLWVPILVVLSLSACFDLLPTWWHGSPIEWVLLLDWHAWAHWLLVHWRELAGIYLAFLWIVWRSVRKASDVRWTMIGDLADTLEGADRYFAIGTIPLREWFEPNTLLYIASIIQQQFKQRQGASLQTPPPSAPFRHERVLLFFSNAEVGALQASYLDQHYARSFSAIHDRFNIALAYIRPKEIHDKILSKLSPEQRWILAPYQWFAKPRRLWETRIFRSWAKNTDRTVPFAVTYTGTQKAFVRFLKDGNSLTVEKIDDKPQMEACEAMVKLIEGIIYKTPATSGELLERYKFGKYLCP